MASLPCQLPPQDPQPLHPCQSSRPANSAAVQASYAEGVYHFQSLGAVTGNGLGAAVHRRPVIGASDAQRALARCAGPRIPGVRGAGLVCMELRKKRPLQPQVCHLHRRQGQILSVHPQVCL